MSNVPMYTLPNSSNTGGNRVEPIPENPDYLVLPERGVVDPGSTIPGDKPGPKDIASLDYEDETQKFVEHKEPEIEPVPVEIVNKYPIEMKVSDVAQVILTSALPVKILNQDKSRTRCMISMATPAGPLFMGNKEVDANSGWAITAAMLASYVEIFNQDEVYICMPTWAAKQTLTLWVERSVPMGESY